VSKLYGIVLTSGCSIPFNIEQPLFLIQALIKSLKEMLKPSPFCSAVISFSVISSNFFYLQQHYSTLFFKKQGLFLIFCLYFIDIAHYKNKENISICCKCIKSYTPIYSY